MGHAAEMLARHPKKLDIASQELVECIEARFDCAQTRVACADACRGRRTSPAWCLHSREHRQCRHLRDDGAPTRQTNID
jgi:hypothetical protein